MDSCLYNFPGGCAKYRTYKTHRVNSRSIETLKSDFEIHEGISIMSHLIKATITGHVSR